MSAGGGHPQDDIDESPLRENQGVTVFKIKTEVTHGKTWRLVYWLKLYIFVWSNKHQVKSSSRICMWACHKTITNYTQGSV